MARSRFIRPEFFTDEKVGELSYGARLLFIGIWCHCDLRGVFELSPKQLRVLVFPFDEALTSESTQQWLTELLAHGMIVRFESDGKTWGYVRNWARHQQISTKEKAIPSQRPPPPDHDPGPVHSRDVPGSFPGRAQAASPTATATATPTPTPTPTPAAAPGARVTPPRTPCTSPETPLAGEARITAAEWEPQLREALAVVYPSSRAAWLGLVKRYGVPLVVQALSRATLEQRKEPAALEIDLRRLRADQAPCKALEKTEQTAAKSQQRSAELDRIAKPKLDRIAGHILALHPEARLEIAPLPTHAAQPYWRDILAGKSIRSPSMAVAQLTKIPALAAVLAEVVDPTDILTKADQPPLPITVPETAS
jgi:hypothetical protein